ncbi:Polypeptide N-acetylgalactosaminyltransferase 1 [Thelohanellus kitauei]|uniref:Polypeptide N-acetylgalactosaminyltransferase 1 n=1 Tax=Thelohanellus kitauei TaxID=669202 RepID=A0A0C2NHK7_THEKT|nr:Polypeptide N-acetylgalactosaminyltransferase 1 [Thelohanellus kitauei]
MDETDEPKNPLYDENEQNFGDYGFPVSYEKNETNLVKESISFYGYNQIVSEKIGVTRQLGDMRHWKCKNYISSDFEWTVSVIIVFFDEGWSILIRAIMSVIRSSSKNSIKEIILVDDKSSLSNS